MDAMMTQPAVDIKAIKCVCTDSHKVMVQSWHDLQQRHKHMVTIPYPMHVTNIFARDVHAIKDVQPVVHMTCKIVNFFMKSHKWFAMAKNGSASNTVSKHPAK